MFHSSKKPDCLIVSIELEMVDQELVGIGYEQTCSVKIGNSLRNIGNYHTVVQSVLETLPEEGVCKASDDEKEIGCENCSVDIDQRLKVSLSLITYIHKT